jgi:hypothetical protein
MVYAGYISFDVVFYDLERVSLLGKVGPNLDQSPGHIARRSNALSAVCKQVHIEFEDELARLHTRQSAKSRDPEYWIEVVRVDWLWGLKFDCESPELLRQAVVWIPIGKQDEINCEILCDAMKQLPSLRVALFQFPYGKKMFQDTAFVQRRCGEIQWAIRKAGVEKSAAV